MNKPRGAHALLDGWGASPVLLNDAAALTVLLQQAVEQTGAQVLAVHTEQFTPQGVTVALVLAESHASLHTYPEHGVYMADVFTCGDVQPDQAVRVLQQALGGHGRARIIERGVTP